MRSAVIVSTARTPIGKAVRGAFNITKAPTLGALSLREAVARARIDPAEVDDVVFGSALQQGAAANNIGRLATLRAGLPYTIAAQSMDRQCSSGVMAIATAAKQIIVDRMNIVAGGGQESISLIETPEFRIDFGYQVAQLNAMDAANTSVQTSLQQMNDWTQQMQVAQLTQHQTQGQSISMAR